MDNADEYAHPSQALAAVDVCEATADNNAIIYGIRIYPKYARADFKVPLGRVQKYYISLCAIFNNA
jgi:hypothetical protein